MTHHEQQRSEKGRDKEEGTKEEIQRTSRSDSCRELCTKPKRGHPWIVKFGVNRLTSYNFALHEDG
jgi:hypothetical protein